MVVHKLVAFTLIAFASAVVISAESENGTRTKDTTLEYFGPDEYRNIRDALKRTVEVKFKDVAFRDAVSALADMQNIPIWVDEQTISQAGISIEPKANLSLPSVSLASCLVLLLDSYDLDFTLKHDVLCITTKEAVRSTNIALIYRINSDFNSQDIAKLIEKEARSLQASGENARGTIVQVLRRSNVEDRSIYLYINANRYTHNSIKRTLKLLE